MKKEIYSILSLIALVISIYCGIKEKQHQEIMAGILAIYFKVSYYGEKQNENRD